MPKPATTNFGLKKPDTSLDRVV